ncbi:MAG: hypothetical protein O4808_05270, partial [Trichodesmium sp. St17_bin3_1_1]|nr:hypothetical protein [Trichodesmium sp. St17_bin3_1_1]
ARLTARRIEGENTRSLALLGKTSSSNLMLLQILRYAQAFPQTFNSLSQVRCSAYSCLIHF